VHPRLKRGFFVGRCPSSFDFAGFARWRRRFFVGLATMAGFFVGRYTTLAGFFSLGLCLTVAAKP